MSFFSFPLCLGLFHESKKKERILMKSSLKGKTFIFIIRFNISLPFRRISSYKITRTEKTYHFIKTHRQFGEQTTIEQWAFGIGFEDGVGNARSNTSCLHVVVASYFVVCTMPNRLLNDGHLLLLPRCTFISFFECGAKCHCEQCHEIVAVDKSSPRVP